MRLTNFKILADEDESASDTKQNHLSVHSNALFNVAAR